jgi:hypothetical protein
MRHFEYVVPSTRPREATIQLSDTFSEGWAPAGAPPVADFDSLITAQVRNTGQFVDVRSPIGAWPHTGNYGAVLLAELRQEQQRLYSVYENYSRTELPDARVLADSLDQTVVGVINWAPRTEEHHSKGQNGEDFYMAELGTDEGALNIQLFSQLPFLAGVAGRGLISKLWRVRDDNPVWPCGEQFRSSIVSQLRNFPEGVEWVSSGSATIDQPGSLSLAFADKYGNGRLEKPAGIELPELPGNTFCLRVDGRDIAISGVRRLTEIPENELGVYANPADIARPDRPHYLELVRRVSNPNDPRNSAYETLRRTVLPDSPQHPDWRQVEMEIVA